MEVASTSPSIAVIGALAYDQIGTTVATFSDERRFNAKLTNLAERFGGCAGNIAYNLTLLDCSPHVLSFWGDADYTAYRQHLRELGISASCILRTPGHTARAIVLTDPNGDQFTAFYPGHEPDTEAWTEHLEAHAGTLSQCSVVVIAPLNASLTRASIAWLRRETENTLMWCPGQYAEFLGEDTLECFTNVDWLICNEGEFSALQRVADPHNTQQVLRTSGSGPVTVYREGNALLTQAVAPVTDAIDPTGCGDALLAGWAANAHLFDSGSSIAVFERALEQAIGLAAECLKQPGSQNHQAPLSSISLGSAK